MVNDFTRPALIAKDVYWVGSYSSRLGIKCNPYLIIDGDEAVVIDGGSRDNFPTIMVRILQSGVVPSDISTLIYQHYDPDRCGSITNFEDVINKEDLCILSDEDNLSLISHYRTGSKVLSLEDINYTYKLKSGRELVFHKIPYANSSGSFITFDKESGVVFSSDLFSGYGNIDNLFIGKTQNDKKEIDEDTSITKEQMEGILSYHKKFFSSERALKHSLEIIAELPFKIIAPKKGCIIRSLEEAYKICVELSKLKGVGIDGMLGDRIYSDMGNLDQLKKRLV